jgi:hypothetical protein
MQWYLRYRYENFHAQTPPDDYIGPFVSEFAAMGHQAKYGPQQAKIVFTQLTVFDQIMSPEDAIAYVEARA